MSNAVIRLQNHGCKNHPYFWIVVASKKCNIKGRIIEHVGYWIPYQRKTVQRSLIFNKPRLLFWLANGAKATPKVHQFLSYIDFLPKPLIKHGTKTLYEKPKKVMKPNHRYNIHPFNQNYEKKFISQIVEQENENLMKREIFQAQEKLKKQTIEADQSSLKSVKELSEEWDKLKAELYQMEKDTKIADPIKRENLFKRINQVAEQWRKEKAYDEFKTLNQQQQRKEVTDDNVRRQLILKNMLKKYDEATLKRQEWFTEMKPLSLSEIQLHLQKNSSINPSRIPQIIEDLKHYASEEQAVITKWYLDDYLRHDLGGRKNEGPDYFNMDIKKYDKNEYLFIPTQKPVHPLPDLTKYDPEDYTDIKNQRETLIKNKSYSIPNVYMEGPDGPFARGEPDVKLNFRRRIQRGRMTQKRRPQYKFSTMKQVEDLQKAVVLLL